MAQDTVADALNMIKNAKKTGKESVRITRISNLLIEILKIMKQKEAVKRYKIDSKGRTVEVVLGDFIECRAIKPRFSADKSQIEKYRRRYLPARNLGTMIISTNQGLMSHEEATEKGVGGSLIAYFY
ncbi:MAG: 30S ribosomal protein S8 [Nanoarchaeota archaeon]|nr:30S ribosomal protein S8 [Nanoarchaeota archaeon]